MNRALDVGLGALLGLGAGWLLFVSPPVASGAGMVVPAITSSGTGGSAGGLAVPRIPGGASVSTGIASAVEAAQLRARVAELEHKLAVQNKVADEKDGAAIPMPEHVDPRFSPEKIRVAINVALKQAGLEGEATSVDCSEFPCLAIGEIKGTAFGPELSQQVGDALSKNGYDGDSEMGLGTSVEENGQRRNLFGLAIYPKTDGDQQQLIGKRVHYRFNTSQGIE